MPQSLASRSQFLEISAAMSRHPASAGAAAATLTEPASFAAVAALLTGAWRVDDPVGFAAAMRAAPLVAGYPVLDLGACLPRPAAGLDPLSAAVAGHLESAVSAAPGRPALGVRWVAARAGSDLYVEAAARAPAGPDGPELLVSGTSCNRWPARPPPTTTHGSWPWWETGGEAWPAWPASPFPPVAGSTAASPSGSTWRRCGPGWRARPWPPWASARRPPSRPPRGWCFPSGDDAAPARPAYARDVAPACRRCQPTERQGSP